MRSFFRKSTQDMDSIMSDDHHSVMSFDDFEREHVQRYNLPSAHSEFKSEESEAESEPSAWDPPAWRGQASGFYHRQPLFPPPSISPSRSRHSSPRYESADEGDITFAASVPLPESPLKGTPANSPEPDERPQVTDQIAEYLSSTSTSASSSREPSEQPPEQPSAQPPQDGNCTYIVNSSTISAC